MVAPGAGDALAGVGCATATGLVVLAPPVAVVAPGAPVVAGCWRWIPPPPTPATFTLSSGSWLAVLEPHQFGVVVMIGSPVVGARVVTS